MKFFWILLLLISPSVCLTAQQLTSPSLTYTDGFDLNLIGQAYPLQKSYHRIDTVLHHDLPPVIKRLFTQAAGLAISFKTNSPRIVAKWCVTNSKTGNNMTQIMNKGLDLYIKRDGVWQFAGVGRPAGVCNEYTLIENMGTNEKECLLYLPLYDEVKSLWVGIDSGYNITAGQDPFKRKRVVVYGSSITQGASASRPGMAYLARLSRETGVNLINLGLSGNGKMEKEVANMIANISADAFILDCFANPSPQQITEKTAYLVKAIRAVHSNVPIVMIQNGFSESGNFNSAVAGIMRMKNKNVHAEFKKLKNQGVKNIYLIYSDNLLGNDHEATADGIHPNDLGFDRMLQVIKPKLLKILNL